MAKNDGGPAFPRAMGSMLGAADAIGSDQGDEGMTLRDWFAGQALAASAWGALVNPKTGEPSSRKSIAVDCYDLADAMLAERENRDA